MEDSNEYITSINFFDQNNSLDENGLETRKCVIETTKNKFIVAINPKIECSKDFGISIFCQDVLNVEKGDYFVGAELFKTSRDVDEFKRDGKFLKYFENIVCKERDYEFFKFETPRGDFFIQAFVARDGNPHEIEFSIESLEFIERINFLNERNQNVTSGNDGFGICKCAIETNKNNYIVTIDPEIECSEEIGIQVLEQDDFTDANEDYFIGAELFKTSRDVDEFKRDGKFLEYYEKTIQNEGDFEFFRFETSKGDFYIQASVWHNGNYPHDIDFIIEPIESID